MRLHPNRNHPAAPSTREPKLAFTWPVLSGDDAPWAVRAAIDAVVAHAYGLTRDQYVHVLSTFSHSSYKDAPRQSLAAFDELQSIGLTTFIKKHDPYWNIPLNENLPQQVIDLPIYAAPPMPHPPSHKKNFLICTPPPLQGASITLPSRWRRAYRPNDQKHEYSLSRL